MRPKRIDDVAVPKQSQKGLVATFAHALFDNGTRMQHNPHLLELAKAPTLRIHPSCYPGKSGDVVTLNNTLTAPIQLDATVAANTVVIPLGFPNLAAHNLAQNLLNGMQVTILKK